MRYRSPDFWSGLALAALGGYIVVQARGWDYMTDDGPGPGFFPLWYGVAILACSAYLVFFGKDNPGDWRGAGRALATWAVLAASVAVLQFVGFVCSATQADRFAPKRFTKSCQAALRAVSSVAARNAFQ